MFRWFKRRAQPSDDATVTALGHDLIGPTVLATAVAHIVANYLEAVKAGTVKCPAYKRGLDDSVVGIWRDTRIEALRWLWGYGASNPSLLADHHMQSEMIKCLLDEQPHLEMPQPRGDSKADTIQAAFQVFCYLGEIGSKVACKETDKFILHLKERSVFDDFTDRAIQLRTEWAHIRDGPSNKSGDALALPKTLFEVLFADVTAKSKSIALTTIWGPDYSANMNRYLADMEKRMADQGTSDQQIAEEISNARMLCERILAAGDPDEIAGTFERAAWKFS